MLDGILGSNYVLLLILVRKTECVINSKLVSGSLALES